jgi:hypothetical protein
MVTRLASGIIRIYTGGQPATPETAASGTLLAEVTFGATSGTVADGVFTANAITQDSAADNSGTAGWFRAFQSNGTTVEFDGLAGAELTMADYNIVQNGTVSITALTYTLPM